MTRSFACPECGTVVVPTTYTAGRRLRCEECGTLVEIPFLPRAASRHSRAWGPGWTWAALGVIAAVLMVFGAVQIARSRGRAAREREVASRVVASEKAEASGRVDEALAQVEAARKLARRLDPEVRHRLKLRRDRLAVLDAEKRLSALASSPTSVEGLRTLRTRVESDGALEPVRDRVLEALSQAVSRRAETDLAEAKKASASGHPEMALALCERVARAADELGFDRAGGVKDSARAVAESVIGEFGVTFAPVTGEFLQGPSTARVHAQSLEPILAQALSQRGYLPRPESSAFLSVWDESAPYRMAISVVERNDGNFFQTPLHTSRLSAQVVLKREKSVVWQCFPQGKTRVPPPTMTAFEQSHLSLAKTRDPAVEKRLYDDARAVLADNLRMMLKGLPGT